MNTQKPEKINRSSDSIEYVDMFYTIQGEGPHAGRPAVFLRLAGCNLQCTFCDTDYTSDRKTLKVRHLADEIRKLASCRFLVITGGEPLRQAESVRELIRELSAWDIQIETNGTMSVCNLGCDIVVSPKTRIHPSVYDKNCKVWLKFLVSTSTVGDEKEPNDVNNMSILPAVQDSLRCYVQPLDEGDASTNAENTALAIRLAMRHNMKVSTQLHKIWGVV